MASKLPISQDWALSDLVVPEAMQQPGTYNVTIKIDNNLHAINYRTKQLHDNLAEEFLSDTARGKRKPPGADGKTRRRWRCHYCLREDFSAKHRLNKHRWVDGCLGVPGYPDRLIRILPYPDMKSDQGKTGEVFRKGKKVNIERAAKGADEGPSYVLRPRKQCITKIKVEEQDESNEYETEDELWNNAQARTLAPADQVEDDYNTDSSDDASTESDNWRDQQVHAATKLVFLQQRVDESSEEGFNGGVVKPTVFNKQSSRATLRLGAQAQMHVETREAVERSNRTDIQRGGKSRTNVGEPSCGPSKLTKVLLGLIGKRVRESTAPSTAMFRNVKPNCNLDLDILECPICFVPFSPPVYQCQNGHSLCSACQLKFSTCPFCSESVGNTRNILVEKIIESLPVRCKYTLHGCKEMLKYSTREEHIKTLCSCRPCPCPVPGCIHEGPKQTLAQHLENHHGVEKVFLQEINPNTGCTEVQIIINAAFISTAHPDEASNRLILVQSDDEKVQLLLHWEDIETLGHLFFCTTFEDSVMTYNLKVSSHSRTGPDTMISSASAEDILHREN